MHKKLAIIGCGELGIQIQNIAKSDDHFEDVIFFDDFIKSNTENKYNIVGKTNEILSSYKKASVLYIDTEFVRQKTFFRQSFKFL